MCAQCAPCGAMGGTAAAPVDKCHECASGGALSGCAPPPLAHCCGKICLRTPCASDVGLGCRCVAFEESGRQPPPSAMRPCAPRKTGRFSSVAVSGGHIASSPSSSVREAIVASRRRCGGAIPITAIPRNFFLFCTLGSKKGEGYDIALGLYKLVYSRLKREGATI